MRRVDHRRDIYMAVGCVLAVLTVFFGYLIYRAALGSGQDRIVINEICSNNFSLVQDADGQYSDYVELYNPGKETVAMTGCFLSDDGSQLHKLPLDAVSVPAGGYAVVWLSGEGFRGGVTPAFGISRDGETVFLSRSAEDEVIDSVAVPALAYDTSYGRVDDGGEWARMTGSAGASNAGAELFPAVVLDAPVCSADSGFYDRPFEVTITAPEDCTVYYTLDGSDPTCDSSVYRGPLTITDVSPAEDIYAARADLAPSSQYTPSSPVDKATVLRAVCYREKDKTVSETVDRVYFVGYGDRPEYDGMPVVSLVTDPDNLFDDQKGIYVNGAALERYKAEGGLRDGELLDVYVDADGTEHYRYMASNAFNSGKAWEREAALTYFDAAHELCFSEAVGIRIAGNSTRSATQKAFNVYSRDIYGKGGAFPYGFFPENKCSSFKLRNGGSSSDTLMFTDAFLETLAEERGIPVQRSTPCVLFLDGEYWGIYNIRERFDEEFVHHYYDVREDNVWIMDGDVVRAGGGETHDAYQYMLDMITQCDLTYDDVYDMVCGVIDVQSLIDFCCLNLYAGNSDVTFGQNTALWRVAEPEDGTYGDGKWRWMLFDMDLSMSAQEDPVEWIDGNALMQEPVIASLMKNESFRRQFCLTFMDIANTTYAYDRVHAELCKWAAAYRDQAVKTHRRFYGEDFDEEDFDGYVAAADLFFRDRLPFAAKGLAHCLGLTGDLETVTVTNRTPEGGAVYVNTAKLGSDEVWSGQYFTDYPITLTAVPEEGYRFAGWSGDVRSGEGTVEIPLSEGGVRVEAVFVKEDR